MFRDISAEAAAQMSRTCRERALEQRVDIVGGDPLETPSARLAQRHRHLHSGPGGRNIYRGGKVVVYRPLQGRNRKNGA